SRRLASGCPGRIRTSTYGSKGRCPAIRRPGTVSLLLTFDGCSFPRPGVWKNKRPWRANQRIGQGRVSPWASPARIYKDLKKCSFERLPDGLKWYRLDGAPMTGHGSGFEEGIVYGLFRGLHGGLEERRHLIVR